MFSLKLNESVDITGKFQHLAFERFFYDEKITEQF